MTQPTLDFTAAPTSLNEKLAAYMRARAGQWLDGRELAKVGGAYAYRTRLSNLRKQPFNLVIENRQRRVEAEGGWGKFVISEYRLVP